MPAHRTARFLVLALAASAPAGAADLLGLYQQARQQDPQYTTARAEYRAAQETMPQARAAVLPQVSLSASASEVEVTEGGETVDGSRNEATLSLTQTLFNWSQFAGLGQAEAQVAQAEAQFAAAEQNLITRLADAYFEVLAAADNLRFAQAEKRAINRQLEQAQQRFEVGVIPITDVKAAQASHDLAVSREIAAQNRLANAREALRTFIGEAPGELAKLGEGLALEAPDPTRPEAWVEQAIERNPDLLAARAGADAAHYGIRVARGGRYPNVELFGNYSDSDDDFTGGAGAGAGGRGGAEEQTTIGVQLNWPLFSGGSTFSQVDEARAQLDAQRSRATEARRAAAQSTRDAYRGVQASISQVRALAQAVASNQAAVEAARAGFEAGTRTSVDVLQALRDLYEAQRDFADARYNYILNRLQLKQAAGTLTVEDVRLVNSWLTAANG